MKLYVKNMVCNRCILVVKSELEKFGIQASAITLGEITTTHDISPEIISLLGNSFKLLGFEIIDDKKSRLIERIKNELIKLVHYSAEYPKINLSDHLSQTLHHDYNYLSSLFSEVEGNTIEKYFISQKIERAKELLMYDELSLSEISYKLGYSSVAYLSNQFKKVTGLTPSHFKAVKEKKRIPLDKL